MKPVTMGVLALQGAFAKHRAVLQSLDANVCEVREPKDLNLCHGLIIPGGESTTIQRLLERNGFFPSLEDFAKKKPLFGTCAGLILMTNHLRVLDITVNRNGYGRQIDSFSTETTLHIGRARPVPFNALFIRAPRIISCGPTVEILASFNQEPILIQQGSHLAATFHPELTPNPIVHQHFLNIIQNHPT